MAENIFEIPAVKTGIVYPETPGEKASLNPEQRLEETVRLAAAINLEVAFAEIVRLRQIRPDAYFGKGVIGRFREAGRRRRGRTADRRCCPDPDPAAQSGKGA